MVGLAIVLAISFGAQEDDLERARILAERGRVEDAIQLLESVSRGSPRPAELVYLAELQAESGALPQAAAVLDRVLSMAPEQNRLRLTRGAMLFELRRYDEARRELDRVLEREKENGLAYYYVAAIHKALGELELARAAAERSIELLPKAAPSPLGALEPAPGAAARHLLAEIRFDLGEEAEPLLQEVVAVEPDSASARYLLARSFEKRGQKREAEAELLVFDRIKRADVHLAQARDLLRVGRREEAITELELAVEAHPSHARALFLLGCELARAGRKEEALGYFARVLALRPDAAAEVDHFLSTL